MVALLGGSSTIRTSVSADIFNAKNDAAHRHEEASEKNGGNDGLSAVTSNPIRVGIYKVATTTPKMIILFNQLADIKVGYFGQFEFVDSQRDHHEIFVEEPMIFPANPTK